MSILYVHLLSPHSRRLSSFPSWNPLASSLLPAAPIFPQLSTFFAACLNKKKRVSPLILFLCPIFGSALLALLPSLSSCMLPSFGPLSSFFLLLPPAGYCRSLFLFLKDYLCSHSDKGFGKGSVSTPSFRPGGPMHGRRVHEGGTVCTSVCVHLSALVMCICTCVRELARMLGCD